MTTPKQIEDAAREFMSRPNFFSRDAYSLIDDVASEDIEDITKVFEWIAAKLEQCAAHYRRTLKDYR
jgi:hypothetical protein